MSVGSALAAPIRTKLVGEDYLQTFDSKFQVYRTAPLRGYMDAYPPLQEYRDKTQREFMQSKGMLIDLWA
jgi:hypothetical protein